MQTTLYKLKNLDLIFLLFLILVLQGDMLLKIVGVISILLLRPKAFFKIRGFSWFYIFILIFHLAFGLLNLLIIGADYLFTFMLVTVFWVVSWVINTQLVYFFERNTEITRIRTLNTLFKFFVLFVLLQYIVLSFQLGTLNPYGVNQASGDYMYSIFANSSVSMLIFSFYFFLYFQKKEWKSCFLALTCLLMAAYMSGTVLFLGSSLLSILVFSNVKFTYKLYFVLLTFVFLGLLVVTSPENIRYASGYIERILNDDETNMPFKIKSFWQTIDYWFSSFWTFIFGAGGGNFSSRAAFIVSGDYVDWFPKSFIYVSDEFSENHFGLWTYDFNNPWDNRNNTANQPFSFYNKIVGEYGLIGLLGFGFFYLGHIIRLWEKLSFSKYMVIALASFFLLDYWFEYFSVIVIFELLVLYDVNQNKEKEPIN